VLGEHRSNGQACVDAHVRDQGTVTSLSRSWPAIGGGHTLQLV
jgi:hypothetical protein